MTILCLRPQAIRSRTPLRCATRQRGEPQESAVRGSRPGPLGAERCRGGAHANRIQRRRSHLGHPVIDSDGHIYEYLPAALPYLRAELGPRLFAEYVKRPSPLDDMVKGPGRRTRFPQSGWWGTPLANTRDLATACSPVCSTNGWTSSASTSPCCTRRKSFGIAGIDDEDFRIPVCRDLTNIFADDLPPVRRSHDGRRRDPDAHAGGGVRRARALPRSGPEGHRHPRGCAPPHPRTG